MILWLLFVAHSRRKRRSGAEDNIYTTLGPDCGGGGAEGCVIYVYIQYT